MIFFTSPTITLFLPDNLFLDSQKTILHVEAVKRFLEKIVPHYKKYRITVHLSVHKNQPLLTRKVLEIQYALAIRQAQLPPKMKKRVILPVLTKIDRYYTIYIRSLLTASIVILGLMLHNYLFFNALTQQQSVSSAQIRNAYRAVQSHTMGRKRTPNQLISGSSYGRILYDLVQTTHHQCQQKNKQNNRVFKKIEVCQHGNLVVKFNSLF